MSKLPRFISTSSDLGRWRKDPRADPTRSRPPAPQKPATRRRRVGSSASRRSRPTGSPPRSSPSHDRKVVSWDRRRSARVGTRTALDRKSVPFNHWSARTVAPPFPRVPRRRCLLRMPLRISITGCLDARYGTGILSRTRALGPLDSSGVVNHASATGVEPSGDALELRTRTAEEGTRTAVSC